MKKSIIALMGLFTLVACSEDAFQDAETLNEEAGFQNQANSFNSNNPGILNPDGSKYPGSNYASPWDLWYRDKTDLQPSYIIQNGSAEDVTPYTIRVRAFVGLAYFDGNNDGIFNDLAASTPTSFNLAGGGYPNLWTALGGQEVGTLIPNSNPFTLPPYPSPASSMRMESTTDHLPRPGINPKHPSFTNGFNFGTLTGLERTFLAQYGKVFFYEVVVTNAATGAPVLTTMMYPEIETLPSGPNPDISWDAVKTSAAPGAPQLTGMIPGGGGTRNLFYYYSNSGGTYWPVSTPSLGTCDSREVIFDAPNMHTIALPGGFSMTLTVLQSPTHFWQNSSLYLNVYS